MIRLGGAALLVGACLGAWLWFTAPPSAALAGLAALAAEAQSDADGILVIGDPARSARWLARHPQALAPLAAAAPEAVPALRRLEPAARVLATRARADLLLWWRRDDAALAAVVDEDVSRSLVPLAAAGSLHYRIQSGGTGPRLVMFATAGGLLDARGVRSIPGSEGTAMALARVGDRWWLVTAGRNSLRCTTGRPPALADPGERFTAAFTDLRRHVPGAARFGVERRLPVVLSVDPQGWSLAFPDIDVPDHLAKILGASRTPHGGTAPGPRPLRGSFGEAWLDTRRGLALGSSAERLSEPVETPVRDTGAVRGAEMARLLDAAAQHLEWAPGVAGDAAALSTAARLLAGLRLAVWDVGTEGGHVRLEW